MNLIQQIQEFDNASDVNDFLKTLDSRMIVSITPFYNTIAGGVIYVVVYLKSNKEK